MRSSMKDLARVGSKLACLLLLTACPPPPPPTVTDIFVEGIEVTQAIQTATNSIDLVNDRSTAVRVRVGVVGGGPAAGVTGVLRVSVDGVEVTPVGGVPPINPGFAAPASALWDRDNVDHTLNFELSAPTGISPTTNADFEIELSALPGEPTGNNAGSANNLTVVERLSPRLYYTRINYTPAGAGLPAIADIQAGVGDAFVDGIYPVDDSDVNLYRVGLFPTLTWNQDPNGNSQIDSGNNEHSDILDWLETCRQLIVNAEGNGDNIFLYGWIAGNPIPSNGWGRTGGRVAFGNTQQTRHQRTYAHELGHNFGLPHNNRTLDPDTGWDTGARLDGNPAGNNTTGRAKPRARNDIMVGGLLTNQAWVDQTTYEYFLGHGVLAPDGGGPDSGDKKRFQRRIVAVSGVLTPDGRRLTRFNPVFRYPWLAEASINDPSGQYIVQAETEGGNVFQTSFNGILGDDSGRPGRTFGFFSVRLAVPANEEIVSVIVIRRADGSILGRLKPSRPPKVEIVSPPDGAYLSGQVTVKFEVRDPDTSLEEIRVQIAYSRDGGRQWVPVAVNVPASEGSATFPAVEVVGTNREPSAVIRAIVSDGLNTAFDDAVKLTVVGAR